MSPGQGYTQLPMELQKGLGGVAAVREHERQGDAYGRSIELCGEAWGRVGALDAYVVQPEAPRFGDDEMCAPGGAR
jgi:hypothetical protein